jgi:hypothetical protein
MADSDPVGDYCDYLDKEMTIMGVLSAFSVAVPALVLDRIAGAKEAEQPVLFDLWKHEQVLLATGSLAFFLAALAFYLQRSHLAFYYGQLRLSRSEARYKNVSSKDLLTDADSWATWISYNNAFALLILGFVIYGIALFAPSVGARNPTVVLGAACVPTLVYMALNWRVRTTGADEDHPWRAYFHLSAPTD